ncbi:hypothetical protein FQZ97_794180 [compost metagenome]
MTGYVVMPKPMQQVANCVGVHNPALALPWEKIGAPLNTRQGVQHLHHLGRKGDIESLAHLHALSRQRPDTGRKIELMPGSEADHLSTRSRKNHQAGSHGGAHIARSQLLHQCRHLAPVHRREVLALASLFLFSLAEQIGKVPAPAGRVVAISQPPGLSGV